MVACDDVEAWNLHHGLLDVLDGSKKCIDNSVPPLPFVDPCGFLSDRDSDGLHLAHPCRRIGVL